MSPTNALPNADDQASPRDALYDDLLDYYRQIVTGVMMPTIDPSSNPWLQIYFPLALGETPTPSQLALRHALMSVAAHQRAHREGKSKQQDVQRAFYHEQEASRMLEEAVNSEKRTHQAPRDKCTSLAAALGLISIDVFSPRATDYSIRLDLARQIIDMHGNENFWGSSTLSSMLYQIFRCYDIVASTAKLMKEPIRTPPENQSHGSGEESTLSIDGETLGQIDTDCGFEGNLIEAQHFILDTSFGISIRTISLLHQTVKLGALYAGSARSQQRYLIQMTRNLFQSLYSIEDDPSAFIAPVSPQRCLPCLHTQSFLPNPPIAPKATLLPKVVTFHYAVILYFHRLIPASYILDMSEDETSNTDGHVPRRESIHGASIGKNYQALVRKVWDRLENIDCLTRDIQLHRGNVLWPAFIAAAESVEVHLRHRALIWFSKAARRGVGNTLRAKEVVMEVWRQVDRHMNPDGDPVGIGPVDWRVAVIRNILHDMSHIRPFAAMTARHLKTALLSATAESNQKVTHIVQGVIEDIRTHGDKAVRSYSEKFDDWSPQSFKLSGSQIQDCIAKVPTQTIKDIKTAQENVRKFAEVQRSSITDIEVEISPGVILGHRNNPISRVGAYIPGGRYPLLASAHMTITTAKVAGVKQVIACTPPIQGQLPNATVAAAHFAGADEIFILGGTQAIAAMAVGTETVRKVDFIAGPGNAFVAEAKRLLFGEIGIDLFAGPTEVLIVADEHADPFMVATDLLSQAEHGPDSPAILITTSERVGQESLEMVDKLLERLPTAELAGVSWKNYGEVVLVDDIDKAYKLADEYSSEHVQILTQNPREALEKMTNYGALFLGGRTCVSYGDKCIGTNHVLPTRKAGNYTGGLWVGKFLKTQTYQEILDDKASGEMGRLCGRCSRAENFEGHARSGDLRAQMFLKDEHLWIDEAKGNLKD
ncbi:histidinol dehydrogenase-domain-containing protein [Ilyonectria sp. MPI-CAGE-AT-0026]|nr:histidinol dehydrogenase-domain-containing protein [Ilyonectria sp. MPI-CAGE-AT-0026]